MRFYGRSRPMADSQVGMKLVARAFDSLTARL
jgi:hypothetical protein